MSLVALPPELIGQIVSEVVARDRKLDRRNREDLRNLCLTAKVLLPHAREALYADPLDSRFQSASKTRGKHHTSLLNSLQSNGGELGKLVKSLNQLAYVVMCAEERLEDKTQWAWIEYERIELERWYIGMVAACPRVTDVHLLVPSKRVLDLAIEALVPALPHLLHLEIIGGKVLRRGDPPLDRATLLDKLRRHFTPTQPRLESLSFNEVDKGLEPTSPLPPLAIAVENLYVDTVTKSPSSVLDFLPLANPETPLRRFDVSYSTTTPVYDTTILSSIGQRVGSTLQSLRIRNWPKVPANFEEYRRPSTSLPLPSDGLHYFPELLDIALNSTQGPSLHFLETIATTCPLLTALDFGGSRWVTSDLDLPATQDPTITSRLTPDDVFPEQQILEAYKKFPRLNQTGLGFLPTTSRTRYEGLRKTLEGRGFDLVQYDICEADDPFLRGESSSEGESGGEEDDDDDEEQDEWTTESEGEDVEAAGTIDDLD